MCLFLPLELEMSVPFGVFAAQKVRQDMNLAKEVAKTQKPSSYSSGKNNDNGYGKKWFNEGARKNLPISMGPKWILWLSEL